MSYLLKRSFSSALQHSAVLGPVRSACEGSFRSFILKRSAQQCSGICEEKEEDKGLYQRHNHLIPVRLIHSSTNQRKDESISRLNLTEKIKEGKVSVGSASKKLPTTNRVPSIKQKETTLKHDKARPTKSLTLRSNIAAHDLSVKTSQIIDWLTKGQEIRITIKKSNTSTDQSQSATVFENVTMAVKDLATVKESKKTESDLVFVLSPKPSTTTTTAGGQKTDDKQKPLTLKNLKELTKSKGT